jgi:transcriptional repressor NrdR
MRSYYNSLIFVTMGDNNMKCPYCGYAESKVIDSRPAEEGATIRRRRECLACQKRFTTYEIMERLPLVVIKRDGSRQTFDKVKLVNSMLKACEKRSVSIGELEAIADEIEQELQNALEREITTEEIGELVMDKHKELDEVSYVRFASVYRQFKDINTFMEELTKLLGDKK